MAIAENEQIAEEGKARPVRSRKSGKGGNWIGGARVKAADAGVGRTAVAQLLEAAAAIINTSRDGEQGTKKAGTRPYRKRPSKKDGAEMLKHASDQALVEITKEVVSKLKDGAKEGNVVCVKTLMSFSEKKKPLPKKKNKRLLKWIEEVRKGSQWQDPPDARMGGRNDSGTEGGKGFALIR